MNITRSTGEPCRLCGGQTREFWGEERSGTRVPRRYDQCDRCKTVQVRSLSLPTFDEERQRYDLHDNDPSDLRYRKYQNRFFKQTVAGRLPEGARVLDMGCGASNVLVSIMNDAGLDAYGYDPVYFPREELLFATYDAVTAVEVVEHVHRPAEFFERVARLTVPGALVALQTSVLPSSPTEFGRWWYRQDATHVTFSSKETLEFITSRFLLGSIESLESDRVVIRRGEGEAPKSC